MVGLADRALDLTRQVAKAVRDSRRRASCRHDALSLIRQRVYALAQGWEDLNDHDQLRSDTVMQTAVGSDAELASASTLCRFEQRMGREEAWAIHRIFMDQFISSFKAPPKRLILDFDATDDQVHGKQEGRFYHGYYKGYCFLPLYVFCRSQLLACYLRTSKKDAARHAWAILSLLVKRLRQAWPDVEIVFRGDSGFCRWRMLRWCDRHRVRYIVGIASNSALNKKAKPLADQASEAHAETGRKQRLFGELSYAAGTWDRSRRVIVKAEHLARGANTRYVVTNLKGDPKRLYDWVYCARGEMENRIKEQQIFLFADRTSCHEWWPNQFRMILSGLAYALLDAIRRLALSGTALARAYVGTIRLKLLRIGAVVVKNTRRIQILLPSSHPCQELFAIAAKRLKPG